MSSKFQPEPEAADRGETTSDLEAAEGRRYRRAALFAPGGGSKSPRRRSKVQQGLADQDEAISRLVWELDSPDHGHAEESQYELQSYGAPILRPLVEAAPTFDRFGQLCAIELLEGLGDPRAADALIPMLQSPHETVRDWAASALGVLGVEEAIPELRRAYEEIKQQGTPLDEGEPESLRWALTQLRARNEVVPPRVSALSRSEGTIERCWAVEDLAEVIAELANAEQLVLGFSFWERKRRSHFWKETPGWELDWSLPWRALVDAARNGAVDAARLAGRPKTTVAMIWWMSEGDR